jgi:hypothetical protein
LKLAIYNGWMLNRHQISFLYGTLPNRKNLLIWWHTFRSKVHPCVIELNKFLDSNKNWTSMDAMYGLNDINSFP